MIMRQLKSNFPWKGFLAAVIGVSFMIIGISRGEMEIVLKKAINICLECIGIG